MTKKKATDLIGVTPEVLHDVSKNIDHWDYDMLVTMGNAVVEVKGYSQWLLGKLGDKASVKYGAMTQYAKDIGCRVDSLKMYIMTYRRFIEADPNFTPDRYHGAVPWSVIQMVGTKSRAIEERLGDNAVETLDDLATKNVRSEEHAYRELKKKETGQDVPRKPKIKLKLNNDASKWIIITNSADWDLIDWSEVREDLINYLKAL